ncbi:ubiquitin-conjugating enzyme [Plasmodium ovale curtisi]|uniref:Ubiquitin-conjugating enzyme n=1 Tax=Plasmodium ovale curtisi TaxID=864141 RepID=A0A1A8VSD0_PLAOA|nr:ubiquitin-conjugating enzyme [Plasmodium ovale curtisi]
MNHQASLTRKQCDFTKLLVFEKRKKRKGPVRASGAHIMAGYDLELNNGSTQDFDVMFHGPNGTAYEGGIWKVHVTLPDDYPFASPSIGFMNKLLHPNVDEASGSVCLDVINQTWTPLYKYVKLYASKDLWDRQKKEKNAANINGNISPVSELSYVDQEVQDIDLENL